MRGVIGELKRGSFVHFTFDHDAVKLGILQANPANQMVGFYQPVDITLSQIDLTYSDVLNRAVIRLHKNLACPKIKIYTRLAKPDELAIPQFYIEEHLEIDHVNLTNEKRTITGDKVNTPLLNGKTVNLWDKLFFEQTAPPLIKQVIKSTPVGDIKVVKKRIIQHDF